MNDWWKPFFDSDYFHVWSGMRRVERTAQEAEGLWQVLGPQPGSRVLDAPCGYERLSRALAERGSFFLGVEQSQELLTHVEEDRGQVPSDRLRYLRHDLREPLGGGGFDAAFNVFTSIGYGTEDDDLAVFRTLRSAVHPGGLVFVETMHRDALAAFYSRESQPGNRLSDGTLVVEESSFDPASLRLYTATELVRLIELSGLRFRSAHRRCSLDPFKAEGMDMGGRLGILAERNTSPE